MKNFLYYTAQLIDKGDISGVPDVGGTQDNSRVTTGFQIAIGIFAAAAVLIIAINAFRIIISRGNAQDVAKARDGIIYALAGLVICMAAFIIVEFVLGSV